MKQPANTDRMTPTGEKIKKFPIRWRLDSWKIVSKIAIERETSVQAIVTEAVSQYLGIPIETKMKRAAQE